MEFSATLTKPSSKVRGKSEYNQATLGFTKGTEDELDRIISDLYKRAENQCNRIISIIKSEAEKDLLTTEFSTSYDNQELVDGTEAEFDETISDLFKRIEDQYNEIISIIRNETGYEQVTSELATSFDNRELADGIEAEFEQIISDLFKKAEDQCNQIISITKSEAEYEKVNLEQGNY